MNIKAERITLAELDLIAALGIKRVRAGFAWYDIEKEKGVYRFDHAIPRSEHAPDFPERYSFSAEWIIDQIVARGLHVDMTLHVGNALYTGAPINLAQNHEPPLYRQVAPQTPEHRAAFATMAAATARHFQLKHGAAAFTWHLWNEPDHDGSWPPKADGVSFGQLLQATCEAIRAVVPNATIMGPALGAHGNGDMKLDFIKAMFTAANPLPCLNAFTIHPYRSYAPETATKTYAEVAQVLAPWQPKDKPPVPLAVDEWGYSINQHRGEPPAPARWRDFSGEEQAALMLRMYLTNLVAGLPLTTLYDWRDRGTDPYEWEDHFGVMGFKGEEKPALTMFRATWKLLLGRPLLAPVPLPHCPETLHALRFGARADDARSWLLVWTETRPQALSLRGKPASTQDIFGQVMTLKLNDHKLEATPQPLLLAETPAQPLSLSCGDGTKQP